MNIGDIKAVGVVGAGSMGAGIAQVAAQSGFQVRVVDVGDAAGGGARKAIAKSMERMVAKEKITAEQMKDALERITFSTDHNTLKGVPFLFEAVFEDVEVKKELFGKLDAVCGDDAVYATNTSSISITEKAVTDLALAMAGRLGKTAITCKDTPGFVLNRLLIPYMIDAVRLLEAGVASAEDIDKAMKLGAGFPMGPFELMDFTGVEISYLVGEMFYKYTKEPRFAAPGLLRNMVKAGYLGRKTGKGFYDYSEKK